MQIQGSCNTRAPLCIRYISVLEYIRILSLLTVPGYQLYTLGHRPVNVKKDTDWLKRWMEAPHNIYVEKCFVIGQ